MSKRGIIGRVAELAHANVDVVIDSAEDPQQVLDQLVRGYATTIAETEQAVAQLTGSRRIAQDDQDEDAAAAALWSRAAETASQTADELRAAGDAADADAFDNLAKVALARQLTAQNEIETLQHTITAQTESVKTLTRGLDQMRIKASDLSHRQDHPVARVRGARARPSGQGPIRSVDIMDPASEAARFLEIVRRVEARVRGAGDVQASPLAAQFIGPEDRADEAEIEERLKALKTGRAMASALARAQDEQVQQGQGWLRADQPLRPDSQLRPDQLFR